MLEIGRILLTKLAENRICSKLFLPPQNVFSQNGTKPNRTLESCRIGNSSGMVIIATDTFIGCSLTRLLIVMWD